MYHFFRQNPLVRPAVFFMCGIVCQQSGLREMWLLLALMLVWHVLNSYFDKSLYKTSLFLPALFLALGYGHAHFYQASERPQARLLENYPQSLIQIEDFPEEKANFYKISATCLQVNDSTNTLNAACEPVQVFIEKTPGSGALTPGDRIVVSAVWLGKFPKGNPEAFDYQQFLVRKNIRYQAFVKNHQLKKEGRAEGFSILYQTRHWRKHMTARLDKTIGDSVVSSIAKAILLGDIQDLDDDVKSSFSLTGTMHVLAVSGMHVVIMFMILKMLFAPIRNSRIRSLIILLILWWYAALTGLSASVLRSVVMFSFVICGQELNRKTSVYNSLALAALSLALIEPAMIYQVGFQLSFLAVLGIVFFHPFILQLFPTDKKWKKYILELIGLSLAAQLATFPLSTYYFHQFPNYFLLSNLLIVPLSNPILILSLCVLVFSWVPYLSGVLAWCLKTVTWITIYLNDAVAALPYANSSGIPFNGLECLLVYLLMICLSAWLIQKKTKLLRLAMITFFILVSVPAWQFYNNQPVRQLILYQVKGKTCIEIQTGNKLHFFGDEPDPVQRNYHTNPYIMSRGFRGNVPWQGDTSLWTSFPFGKGIQLFGKRIILVNDSSGIAYIAGRVDTDLLIISKNVRIKAATLLESLSFRKLVLDSSNEPRTRKFWLREAAKGAFRVYDVMEEGAFTWNFYE